MDNAERQGKLTRLRELSRQKPTNENQAQIKQLLKELESEGQLDLSFLEKEGLASEASLSAVSARLVSSKWVGGAFALAVLAFLFILGSIIVLGFLIFPGYQRADQRHDHAIETANARLDVLSTTVHSQAAAAVPPTSELTPISPTPVTAEPTALPSLTTPAVVNWVFAGHVYKKGKQEGIENITVHLKRFDGQQCLEPDLTLGQSDADGNFKLEQDLQVPVRVCIQADLADLWNEIADVEFANGWERFKGNVLASPELTDASQEIGGNIFYLDIRRTFSGKVVDEQENGLKTAVSLYWKADEKEDWLLYGEPAQTDDSGAFKIEWHGIMEKAFYKLEQELPEGYTIKEIEQFGAGTWKQTDKGNSLESSVQVVDSKFEGAVFKNVKQQVLPIKPTATATKPTPTVVPPISQPAFAEITLPDKEVNVYSAGGEGSGAWAVLNKKSKKVSIQIFWQEKNLQTGRIRVKIEAYVKDKGIDQNNTLHSGTTLYWRQDTEVGTTPGGENATILSFQDFEDAGEYTKIKFDGWIAEGDLPQ